MQNRNKLLAMNGVVTIIMQVVKLICGLILPRLILRSFGSNANGLVTSITQFLSFISLLDGGLGGVIRAAYYKPLAEKDYKTVSKVFAASKKFSRQICYFFIFYLIFLAFIFPVISHNQFGFLYTFLLVIIISLTTLLEYMWGYSLKLLVFSDQKGYIYNFTQILTTIFNTVLAALFIHLGAGIHVVNLIAAIAYSIQPIFLGFYVSKNYKLDKKAEPDENAIKDRWSALARHIAYYIHTNTDVVVLTLFTSFSTVSIYSVYNSVVTGITNLVAGVISNTEATFGNFLAQNQINEFQKEFKSVDLISKIFSSVFFSTCTIMICIFVRIYTNGVTDANYYRPIFAILICLSEWIYTSGLNYNNIIVSVGHFKQTTFIGFIEAGINVFGSLILVNLLGMEGVVAATCVAMIYKMIANIIYVNKHIIKLDKSYVLRSSIYSFMTFLVAIFVGLRLVTYVDNYLKFFIESFIVFIIIFLVDVLLSYIFCKREFKFVYKKVSDKLLTILTKK